MQKDYCHYLSKSIFQHAKQTRGISIYQLQSTSMTSELVVHLHRNMYMSWFNQKSTLNINPILFKMNALLNSLTGSIFQIINSLLYSCCTVCFTWHKYKSLFKSCMWLWLQLQKKLLQYRFPKLASCLREDALVNHITSLVGKSILNTK